MTQLTVMDELMARSIKDPAFRQEVQNNPREVLANEYNVHLPADVTVHVFTEAPNTLTIVLPPQAEAVQELADSDLEAVAGGDFVYFHTSLCYHRN